MAKVIGHLVDPKAEKWYHYDEDYRLWTCSCTTGECVSLCATIDDSLKAQGELANLKRQIAQKRKELGLLQEKPPKAISREVGVTAMNGN